MAQKVLNEVQLREYVEEEVRKALNENMNEDGNLGNLLNSINGSGFLGKLIEKLPEEALETALYAIIARIGVAPLLRPLILNILEGVGIPADGVAGRWIVNTLITAAGAYFGNKYLGE